MVENRKIKGLRSWIVPQLYLNNKFYEYFSEYFTIKFVITVNLRNQSVKLLELINNPLKNVNFTYLYESFDRILFFSSWNFNASKILKRIIHLIL